MKINSKLIVTLFETGLLVFLSAGFVDASSPILTITANNQSITYGDANPVFTFSYSGFEGGDTLEDIETLPTCTVNSSHINAGTYPIVCSGGADRKYNFAYVDGTLLVNPKALTITAKNQGKTYGYALNFLGTEFTTTGLIFNDIVTSVTLTSAGAPAAAPTGTYPIVPSNAVGNGLTNYVITYVNGTLTVGGNLLEIKANDRVGTNAKTYGDTITFSGKEFNVVGLQGTDKVDSVTLTSMGASANAPVGTYQIIPSAAVGQGLSNYVIIYSTGQMAVTPHDLIFSPDNHTKVYGNIFTAYTGTFTGLMGFDNTITPIFYSLGARAVAPVGTYPITVTLNDPNNRLSNYTVTLNTGTLTVGNNDLIVTPDNKIKVYGDLITAFTGTVVGLQAEDNITATYSSPGAPAAAPVGTYPITVTLNDPNNRLSNYTVTLNTGTLTVMPLSNAGFIIGVGGIKSSAGSYTPDPTLEGNAIFAFFSSYRQGTNLPTGYTEFQFRVANLNFKSISYDWLVITGAKAKYKGTGTINGAGNYAFIISVIDGQIIGGGGVDKFRIKIWDKATGKVILDNMMGAAEDAAPGAALNGGFIVIHK